MVRTFAWTPGQFREIWSQAGRNIVTQGRIAEFQPPAAIAWTWADEDWLQTTLLTLAILPVDGGRLVQLNHSGWNKFDAPLGEELRVAKIPRPKCVE